MLRAFLYACTGRGYNKKKNRTGKEQVPVAAIGGTHKRLEAKIREEGFDDLPARNRAKEFYYKTARAAGIDRVLYYN